MYILFPVLYPSSVTAFFQFPDPVEHSKPIFIAVSIGWMFMSLVVSIISNLLDNAIGACEKVDRERVVQAKI